jgi:hypothetical protein
MPSNAMLAVPAKRAGGFLDLKGPVGRYLQSSFSAGVADQAVAGLQQAQLLRNKAAEMAGGAEELKEAFIGYYRFLTALENAIPVGKERGGAALRFQWTDAFQPDRGDGRSDVAFEKAALLFNLGAIASQVAMGADLSSESGVKNAARSYQEAAGVFGYLAERLVPRLEMPHPIDLSPDCCSMLATLCLAQAQECFYTKAAADRKSPALLARIARQVAEMYRGITAMNLSDTLKRELGKPMAAHLGIKAGLFTGLTLRHQAEVFIEDDECGQQIACLQEAQRVLEAARREGTGWVKVDRELIAKVDEALAGIGAALQKAERENSSLYFQRVPPASDLAPPAPASLVAPVPPPEDLESVDDRWFGFLQNAGAIAQDDRNRNARSAYMGQGDARPQAAPQPTPAQQQAGGGSGVGGTLGRFAFGAAKGVAGWAFNQAVDAIADGGGPRGGATGGRGGADAKSRNIAAMYDAPQTVSIGDLFSSSAAAPAYGRRDSGGNDQRVDAGKYVQRVRDLINQSIDRIASADRERESVLERLRLPEALGALDESGAAAVLPRDVQKQVDAHRRDGGVQHLVQLLRDISELREGAVRQLERVEAQLDAEAAEDEAARRHYGGGAWPLQDASIVAANLRDRIAGYKQNLREADGSDRKLQALVDDNAEQFAALGLGTLPGRSGGQKSRGGGSDVVAATAGVRSDLSEADALAAERRRLHDAFKQLWNEDQIVQRGSARAQWELDQGFHKFEDLAAALERNASAQSQALQRLEADMRQFGDLLASRRQSAQEQAQDAAKTVKRFGNVEQSLRGGMQFYTDLQNYITSLERETNDYLEQRYAEGRDAVALLERTNSQQPNWDTGSGGGGGKQDGGGWLFGGGGGGKKKSNRWFAEPQQPLQGGRSRVLPARLRPARFGRSTAVPLRPRCAAAAPVARHQVLARTACCIGL